MNECDKINKLTNKAWRTRTACFHANANCIWDQNENKCKKNKCEQVNKSFLGSKPNTIAKRKENCEKHIDQCFFNENTSQCEVKPSVPSVQERPVIKSKEITTISPTSSTSSKSSVTVKSPKTKCENVNKSYLGSKPNTISKRKENCEKHKDQCFFNENTSQCEVKPSVPSVQERPVIKSKEITTISPTSSTSSKSSVTVKSPKTKCENVNKSYLGSKPNTISKRKEKCLSYLDDCLFNEENNLCQENLSSKTPVFTEYESESESESDLVTDTGKSTKTLTSDSPPAKPVLRAPPTPELSEFSLTSPIPDISSLSTRLPSPTLQETKVPEIFSKISSRGLGLLTFNNITKYYGDSILINPDNSISNNQWHRFQLVKIAELLKLETRDSITGNLLSRKILGDKIRKLKYTETQEITTETKKYGLIPKKTSSKSVNNLGGIAKKPLTLNSHKNDVIWDTNNEYIYLNQEISPGSDKKIPPVTRVKGGDKCSTGKIALLRNSNKCYMDSVLQVLLISSQENQICHYLQRHLQQLKDSEEVPINITNLAKTTLLLISDLKSGKSPTLRMFINNLRHFPDSSRFITPTAEDPIDFINFLVDILDISHGTYNVEKEYYCKQAIPGVNSINGYGHHERDLIDISSKYLCDSPIVRHSPEAREITIMNPSIRIGDLKIRNGTSVQNLLVWQEETAWHSAKEPYYQIKCFDGWEYTNVDIPKGESVHPPQAPGIFVNRETGQQVTLQATDDFVINTSDETFSYKGKIIGAYGYKYRISYYEINNVRHLIVCLDRKIYQLGNTQIILTKIIPEEIIRVGDKRLQLTGIITHQEGGIGHYFSYYLCNEEWFRYNDLVNEVRHVGSYQDLITKETKMVEDRSTILIYNNLQ